MRLIPTFCAINKTDGRELDAAALAHVHRSLVQAVRGGMSQMEGARAFRSIYDLARMNAW
jgi:hypothetical protein